MTETNETSNKEELGYYFPHHSGVRETSLTTKLRDSGLSLNDTQYVGPTLQSDLSTILLNSRLSTCIISADMSQMFRMVWIYPYERNFQRIFWRNDISDNLKCLTQLRTELHQHSI